MTDTANIGLPLVPENTLDPAAGLNLALVELDALVQCTVIRMDLTAPPGTSADGDMYIVAAPATGDWAGHENDLAYFVQEGLFWKFFTAGAEVKMVLNFDDLGFYRFDPGSPGGWSLAAGLGDAPGSGGPYGRQGGTWVEIEQLTVQNDDSPLVEVSPTTRIIFEGCDVVEETGGVARVTPPGGAGLTVSDEDSPQFFEAGVTDLVIVGAELTNPSPGVVRVEIPTSSPGGGGGPFGDLTRVVRWAQCDGTNTFAGGFDTVASSLLAAIGSLTDPALSAASLLGCMVKKRQTTSTSANQSCGFYNSTSTNRVLRSAAASALAGGFDVFCRFAMNTASAGQRLFVGLGPFTAAPTSTVDPSTYLNCIGLGKDAADTNVQIMHNDGAGSATKIDLGVSMASLQGKVLELTLHCDPNGSTIDYSLLVVDDANTIDGTTGSSNHIAQDVFVGPIVYANNAASGIAIALDFSRYVWISDR